jgi:NAD-specific glutamate dehydrogenase
MTYSSELCIGVVRRSDFDNISGSDVNALKTADDGADLSSRPSTGLGGTSSRSKCWINRIDVDREVDRRVFAYETMLDHENLGILQPRLLTNAIMDLLDDTSGTNRVNLPGLDNLESDIAVIVVVTQPAERSANARVDVGVIFQQTLHGRMVEVGAMVDASNLARSTAEDLGLPSVEMRIEMDDS